MSFAPPPSRKPLPRLSPADDTVFERWVLAGGTMTLEEFCEAGGEIAVEGERFRDQLRRLPADPAKG